MDLYNMRGSTRCSGAKGNQMLQLNEYDTFQDLDKYFPQQQDTRIYGSVQCMMPSMKDVTSPSEWLMETSLIFQFKVLILGLFSSVVSNSLYFFLIPIKLKCGIQILATHTMRKRHLRNFTLQQGLNLVIGKAILLLFPRHNMVHDLL